MRKQRLKSPEFSILVASDWAPIRAFDSIMREDPSGVYGDMLPILRTADLRIVNCECALAASGKPVVKSGSVFKGKPEHIKALTAVPFHVACMANNHVLDYGIPGLRQTLKLFREHGIRSTGAGLTEKAACDPLTLKAGSTRLHLVNFSEGEDLTAANGGPGVSGWDISRIVSTVAQCKRDGGIVIAIGHCGLEYVPYPPAYIVRTFREISDAGADCVIGHHPHVPQGIEWRSGRPILYSLGNFAFFQESDLLHRKTGFCVTLRFTKERLAGMDLHPYRITPSGLRRLTTGEEKEFLRTLSTLSRPFRTRDGYRKAWQAYLAFYGVKGFSSEVSGILAKMNADAPKAAAIFRNRITTRQHWELWCDFLTGVMNGRPHSYSRTAYRMVEEYFQRR
jgi:poly-gamma-glutamate capsule biosynthesis protein CapA/YwtB (metallophosphatase superfamily)